MQRVTLLNADQVLKNLNKHRGRPPYFAMYSTWFNGVVTDPSLMLVPIDDHIVHRGDGVFEAFKYMDGAIFDLDSHLKRLQKSAEIIGMTLPMSLSEIRDKVIEVVKAAQQPSLTLRLYVSRGPGGFDANPYESIGSQLYIVGTAHKPLAESMYEKGVRVGVSQIPMKEGFFSQVKSCNYLPNVLMKKEAKDQGLDFVVNLDESGFVGEGPTENILVLTKQDELLAPSLNYTLAGTTLKCVLELAEAMSEIKVINYRDVKILEIEKAKEVMMIGTTLQVLPVVEFNGVQINTGTPGPVAKRLRSLLKTDMLTNLSRRTQV